MDHFESRLFWFILGVALIYFYGVRAPQTGELPLNHRNRDSHPTYFWVSVVSLTMMGAMSIFLALTGSFGADISQ